MSSPCHTAKCLARNQRIVDIELGPTTAMDVHFPISDFFGLALLHEAATTTLYSEPGELWIYPSDALEEDRPIPPIADAIPFGEVIDLSGQPSSNARKKALTKRFISHTAYVAIRNFTPRLWKPRSSGGFVNPRVAARDPRSIAAHRKLQKIFDAIGEDGDTDELAPHATLRIQVTKAEWCAHLEPGMQWDVYGFDSASSSLC